MLFDELCDPRNGHVEVSADINALQLRSVLAEVIQGHIGQLAAVLDVQLLNLRTIR